MQFLVGVRGHAISDEDAENLVTMLDATASALANASPWPCSLCIPSWADDDNRRGGKGATEMKGRRRAGGALSCAGFGGVLGDIELAPRTPFAVRAIVMRWIQEQSYNNNVEKSAIVGTCFPGPSAIVQQLGSSDMNSFGMRGNLGNPVLVAGHLEREA